MKKYILIILLLSLSVFAKTNVSDFIDEIPKIKNIECKFKQEKTLKGAVNVLKSEGNFKFDLKKGVYFKTLKPYTSEVSYTNKDYKEINKIILAISNKKYSLLENDFDFDFQKNKNHWNLKLIPKTNSTIFEVISSIEIEGNYTQTKTIDKIEINLKNGNKTKIWFYLN
ncbi:outer membrane lipoprotein carrier protein LolA [bacterium]|nr:outer membrane lipoprotein carrier protein LolA [bacterium]